MDDLKRDLAILRKFIYTTVDTEDVHDFHEAATRAAQKLDKTNERLAELEAYVDRRTEQTSYADMTKRDKVWTIRKTLLSQEGGNPSMRYQDVMWLFDGEPSAGHCYNLMEYAADKDGYEYQEFGDDRQHRIVLKTDELNENAAVHRVNNGAGAEEV